MNSFTNLPGIGITPGTIKAGVTYTAAVPNPNANFFNIDAGGGYVGGFLDSLFVPRPLTVTFVGLVGAFGFDANSLAGAQVVTIHFSDGADFATTISPTSLQFFGFASNRTDITGLNLAGNSGVYGFALDNFTFTPGVVNNGVPEPGTYAALAGIGLTGLGILRRRRRS